MDKQIRQCPECGKEGWLEAANTRTTPTPPAGQVEAVARAIYGYLGHAPSDGGISAEYYGAATEAIKACGAEHIAGLVAKNDELRDALLDMVWQFCSRNDKLAHSFMSAEEHAFDVLDLDNGMTYEEAEAASKAAALPPGLRGK
jgi:hypothetical protein